MPRPASPQRLLAQRLGALFVAGVLVFDFPLLRLALGDGQLFGLPRGPLLIFAAWALLIGLLAWWMERGADSEAEADDAAGGVDGNATGARPRPDGPPAP